MTDKKLMIVASNPKIKKPAYQFAEEDFVVLKTEVL